MSSYQPGIEKICKFAFNFFNMNILYVDPLNTRIIEYSYLQIPQPLKGYLEDVNTLNLSEAEFINMVTFHSTFQRLNYITAKIYGNGDYLGNIIIGPYLLEEPSHLFLEEVLFDNQIPISLKHITKQFYQSIPLISTQKAKAIGEFLGYSLMNLHFFTYENVSMGSANYEYRNSVQNLNPDVIVANTRESVSDIEERYKFENRVLHAVESGNTQRLDKLIQGKLTLFTPVLDRIPDEPLRSRKNLSFVLNSLLRKAAEKGGVHPVYIDSISEKFAIRIEKASSLKNIYKINKEMCYEYCHTVKKLSLKNYPFIIRKAIEYIRLNLNHDLSLETIAESVHISPYSLSRQFKKATGESIVDFINKQRVEEAAYLTENKNMSITDISQMVGFDNANYFTKVFKKIKGVTPSEYRKKRY